MRSNKNSKMYQVVALLLIKYSTKLSNIPIKILVVYKLITQTHWTCKGILKVCLKNFIWVFFFLKLTFNMKGKNVSTYFEICGNMTKIINQQSFCVWSHKINSRKPNSKCRKYWTKQLFCVNKRDLVTFCVMYLFKVPSIFLSRIIKLTSGQYFARFPVRIFYWWFSNGAAKQIRRQA